MSKDPVVGVGLRRLVLTRSCNSFLKTWEGVVGRGTVVQVRNLLLRHMGVVVRRDIPGI